MSLIKLGSSDWKEAPDKGKSLNRMKDSSKLSLGLMLFVNLTAIVIDSLFVPLPVVALLSVYVTGFT